MGKAGSLPNPRLPPSSSLLPGHASLWRSELPDGSKIGYNSISLEAGKKTLTSRNAKNETKQNFGTFPGQNFIFLILGFLSEGAFLGSFFHLEKSGSSGSEWCVYVRVCVWVGGWVRVWRSIQHVYFYLPIRQKINNFFCKIFCVLKVVVRPTNIASVNLVMGCSKIFFPHYSNSCPGVLTLHKWRTNDVKTLYQPNCRPHPSLTTTCVDTESECATSDTNFGWEVTSLAIILPHHTKCFIKRWWNEVFSFFFLTNIVFLMDMLYKKP